MPFTAGGIFYRPMWGYPRFGATLSSQTGEEEYMLPWNNIQSFIEESLPSSFQAGNDTVNPPRRRMPGYNYLGTDTLNIEPFDLQSCGGDDNIEVGEWARAKITYTSDSEEEESQNPDDPESFLEIRVSFGGEFLIMSPKGVKLFDPDKKKEKEEEKDVKDPNVPPKQPAKEDTGKPARAQDINIAKRIPLIEYQMTWKHVADPPFRRVIEQIGTVNEKEFLNVPINALLFTGLDASREFTSNRRIRAWQLDFRFVARMPRHKGKQYTWQEVWSPENQKWMQPRWPEQKTVKDEEGNEEVKTIYNKLYDESDFRTLFKAEKAKIWDGTGGENGAGGGN